MELKKCTIDKNEVLRYLGYKGQALEKDLLDRIESIIEKCERNFQPQGVFDIFEVEEFCDNASEKPYLSLRNAKLALSGKSVCRHLGGARFVAVMACTLGVRSEQELQRLSTLEPLAAVIFDASCSSLVECGADALGDMIEQKAAAQSLTVGLRYSPGYGDFPLETQPVLLRSIRAEQGIGLTCTKENLLIPSKSITAVQGLFKQ